MTTKHFSCPLNSLSKRSVSNIHHAKFVEEHGDTVFELEALPPAALQQELREAIRSVIDVDAYNHEVEAERIDAAYLAGLRTVASAALESIGHGGPIS